MAGAHKWIFQPSGLFNTPSRKAGIEAEKELNYRQQCANLIQDMGQRLQVTQLCINTAIVYMHRFYMFHSFMKFHRNPIASACLFLAAKVEEQPRKLEHVIKSYHICVNRDQGPLDVKSETYLEFAQELVCNENILLQTLGFDFTVEHPHQNVVKTCTLVKASKDLAQTSYFLATNSLHLTTMCLKYRHTVVACVCIHLACKWSNYQIPCSSEGKHWFQYVDKDVTLELLEELTQEFLNILENCPSKLKKKILTWKSGQRPPEDTANIPAAAGGPPDKPPDNKKIKFDPDPTSGAEQTVPQSGASNQRPQHKLPHRSQESGGGGLRRVQTEPVLFHKEHHHGSGERKDRIKQGPNHPPPHGGHHREIPGYHGKPGQPGSQKPTGWSGSRPTHPPPPPKSRHMPSAAQGSANRPPSQQPQPTSQQPSTHERPRSNIFEQMQNEHRTEPQRTSNSSISDNSSTQDPQADSNTQFAISTLIGNQRSGTVVGGSASKPIAQRPSQGDLAKKQHPTGPELHKQHLPTSSSLHHPNIKHSHENRQGSSGSHHGFVKSSGGGSNSNNIVIKTEDSIKTDESPGLSTREKIMQAHALKVEKEKERLASLTSPSSSSNLNLNKKELVAALNIKKEPVSGTVHVKKSELLKEPGEIDDDSDTIPLPVSITTQVKQEQDMQAKLQAELKKQEHYVKAKKIKLEKERKEKMNKEVKEESSGASYLNSAPVLKSPELKSPTGINKSPKLRSPPVQGSRRKSDSTSSKSDSDTSHVSLRTPNKDEKHKMFNDHQKKIQEDRKRLRRMSEELGDPKIKQDPVVMLDNVFISPESDMKPQAELLSPLSSSDGKGELKSTPSSLQKQPTGNTPTPNRTISLASYLKRKPLSQSQSKTGTPQLTNDMITNPDKPTLAMEHLASIKLQGLKPLSEILKPTDFDAASTATEESNGSQDANGMRADKADSSNTRGSSGKLEAPSPKKAKLEKPTKPNVEQVRRSNSGSNSLTRRSSSTTLTTSSDPKINSQSSERKFSNQKPSHATNVLNSSQGTVLVLGDKPSGGASAQPTPYNSHSAKHIPGLPKSSSSIGGMPTVPTGSSSTTLQHAKTKKETGMLLNSQQSHGVPGSLPNQRPRSSTPPQAAARPSGIDSPKEKKLSLKIKIGANPSVTMSPGTLEAKESISDSTLKDTTKEQHHRSDKHKSERKKDKHRDKHRSDNKEHKSSRHKDRENSSGIALSGTGSSNLTAANDIQSGSTVGGELKMKLSIKGIKSGGSNGGDSPFKIDNPNRQVLPPHVAGASSNISTLTKSDSTSHSSSGSGIAVNMANSGSQATPAGIPGAGGDVSGITPVKLVIQKDKSGHYSSGHKHKHSKRDREHVGAPGGEKDKASSSNRKRTHSPATVGSSGFGRSSSGKGGSPVVPIKIPRNDPTLNLAINGSSSPSQNLIMQHAVNLMIEKQKKHIKTTLENQSRHTTPTSSQQNSP